MEANRILQSDILDILFDGKNKLYGAYQLRKNYNKRISKALLVMMGFILLLITASIIGKKFQKNKTVIPMVIPGIILKNIPIDKPTPLPKLSIPPVHVATLKVAPPTIVKDNLVNTPPPNVKQIEEAIIDIKTVDGLNPGSGIINPPTEITSSNVIANPIKKKTDVDSHIMSIDVEARFPGGSEAWQKFIRRAIESELDEFSESDYGTCVVKFIVDTNGNVSNVEATTMKGTRLAQIAVKSINKGPHWIPAMKNGHYVTAERYQPITLTNTNQ